jgi:hypothetical protein
VLFEVSLLYGHYSDNHSFLFFTVLLSQVLRLLMSSTPYRFCRLIIGDITMTDPDKETNMNESTDEKVIDHNAYEAQVRQEIEAWKILIKAY